MEISKQVSETKKCVCQAIQKSGKKCVRLCESGAHRYCVLHTRVAYQKYSSKRADIQSSFSNVEPKKFIDKSLGLAFVNKTNGWRKGAKEVNRLKRVKERQRMAKLSNNRLSFGARNLTAIGVQESDSSGRTDGVVSASDVFKMIKPLSDCNSGSAKPMPALAKGYKPGDMIEI